MVTFETTGIKGFSGPITRPTSKRPIGDEEDLQDLNGEEDLQDLNGPGKVSLEEEVPFGFLLKNGKPRLYAARSWFLDLQDNDLDGLRGFYRTWRDLTEYLVLKRSEWLGDHAEDSYLAVKCAKRGNDVYRRRVGKRLGYFHRKDHEFFSAKDRRPKTKVLFFTLTYNPKLGSLKEAWETVGDDFNRWISSLRAKYGRISVLRTWEAHENGYPHVHGVLIFQDHEFQTFRDGSVWRIVGKCKFETWHSFVDIRAVRTFSAVVRYIEKRILRGTEKNDDQEAGDRTLSLCWVFRKRAFSVSRDLARAMVDLIRSMHNSKPGVQKTLGGGHVLVSWTVIGVFSASELGLDDSPGEWMVKLPPKVIRSLELSSHPWG